MNDSEPSVASSAAAERTKAALPLEPMSLELLMLPDEKSEEVTPEPETVEVEQTAPTGDTKQTTLFGGDY